MFAARYFAPRYFAPRYFPNLGDLGDAPMFLKPSILNKLNISSSISSGFTTQAQIAEEIVIIPKVV